MPVLSVKEGHCLDKIYIVSAKGSRDLSLFNMIPLTHWVPVTHTYVNKIIIIGWDNDFSPGPYQELLW